MIITRKQRKVVIKQVEEVFDNLQARMLGRFFPGKKIAFEVVNRVNPTDTLEGMFRFTLHMLYGAGAEVDEDQLKDLAEVAANYLNAKKMQTVNKMLTGIESAQSKRGVRRAIYHGMKDAENYVNLLVNAETKQTQAHAERSGITQVAASMGIDDPTVCKLGQYDGKTCENCIKLWHSDENPAIPKVYKLSELREGYMIIKKGEEPYPTTGNTHPHCRHIMTMVAPHMSFDDRGVPIFKGFGYDEYEAQRGKNSK